MELGVMLPIIVDSLITMLKIVDTALNIFTGRGIKMIVANKERCRELLERSTAYATLLTPSLGYDVVSKVVKESVATGKTIREVILEKKLLHKFTNLQIAGRIDTPQRPIPNKENH